MRSDWTSMFAVALAALILEGAGWPAPFRLGRKELWPDCILGAGTGAIIGSAVGHPGAGAAIGGALGLGTGMLVGNKPQNSQIAQRRTQLQVWRQQRELRHQRRKIERLRAEQNMEKQDIRSAILESSRCEEAGRVRHHFCGDRRSTVRLYFGKRPNIQI
jgi:uncharacterized protein YcfJ